MRGELPPYGAVLDFGSGVGAGAGAGSCANSGSGPGADSGVGADVGSGAGSDVGSGAGSDAGSDVGSDTGSGVGSGANSAAGSDAISGVVPARSDTGLVGSALSLTSAAVPAKESCAVKPASARSAPAIAPVLPKTGSMAVDAAVGGGCVITAAISLAFGEVGMTRSAGAPSMAVSTSIAATVSKGSAIAGVAESGSSVSASAGVVSIAATVSKGSAVVAVAESGRSVLAAAGVTSTTVTASMVSAVVGASGSVRRAAAAGRAASSGSPAAGAARACARICSDRASGATLVSGKRSNTNAARAAARSYSPRSKWPRAITNSVNASPS